MDAKGLSERLEREGWVAVELNGQEVRLNAEDVSVETRARDGLAVAGGEALLVALDTRLDDDLRDEGFAREFVHYVQNLRKGAGVGGCGSDRADV